MKPDDPRLSLVMGGGGSGGGGFPVGAVHFDGDTSLQGIQSLIDGPEGSFVVSARSSGGSGLLLGSDGEYITINEPSGTSFWVYSANDEDELEANIISYERPVDVYAPVFVSWKADLAAGDKIVRIYVGDLDVLASTNDSGAPFDAYLSDDPIRIGGNGGSNFVGDMAELWFDDQFIDFSIAVNRRKFATSTGKPVDLGADGSIPTGAAPKIYLSVRPGDEAGDFCINRGSGGNFTQNGTLTLAGSSPND